MEEKDKYTLQDLFHHLSISIAELSRRSKVNEVTIAKNTRWWISCAQKHSQ